MLFAITSNSSGANNEPVDEKELNLKPIKQQITELVARSVEIGSTISEGSKVFLNERLRASVYGNEIYTVLMWQGKDVDTYLHEMVVNAWSGKCLPIDPTE